MKAFDFIANNFWLKIFSLILAVATWFYVFDLVDSDLANSRKQTLEQMMGRYNFVTKEVPVRPFFMGKSPEGFRVIFEKIKVDPSSIVIFGPQEVVNAVNALRTDTIDLGEFTRSAKLSLGVQSDVKLLRFQDKFVDVYVPVEHIRDDRTQDQPGK